MSAENTPWSREGLSQSAWKRRHRATINAALEALGDAAVQGWTPLQILGHVRAKTRLMTAPDAVIAVALRQSADHRQATQGLSRHVVRLRQAALLAEAGAQGEAAPPSRVAALRDRMQAIVAPFESKPYRRFDVVSNTLTDIWIDPRTGQPLDPQPEAMQPPRQ